MSNHITKKQMVQWASNCRAAAARFRAEGNIKRAEMFDEGAVAWEEAIEKASAQVSVARAAKAAKAIKRT